MPPKKLIEDYHATATAANMQFLGKEATNNQTKESWLCNACGSTFGATYNAIQSGRKCPMCTPRSNRTEEHYRLIGEKINVQWIGPLPNTTKDNTSWKCDRGHIFEGNYADIKIGRGCPVCVRRGKLTIADYENLAKEVGYSMLDPMPLRSLEKLRWQCPKGHIWSAKYHAIKDGGRCPFCSIKRKKTEADFHATAKKYGIAWVGPLPNTTDEKTGWICAAGHYRYTTLGAINRGKACQFCAENAPLTPADYVAAATKWGFVWNGDFPGGSNKPTGWTCSKGHFWMQTYGNVGHGKSGCPECDDRVNGIRVSKPQRQLHEMVGGELNFRVPPYTLDIALPDEKICLEFDSWHFHRKMRAHDFARDEYLIERGWRVLRVKSNMSLPSLDMLADALQVLNEGQYYVEIVMSDWKGYDDE